uniref:Uncharacterized protein LOC104265996 n=1 Tax=Phallusia mammillata TaxID=59560 RepID=A0A6F9DJU5_9ASCI|nr:uncharacterized protein LOC104265996 [Phallusia mammillata]
MCEIGPEICEVQVVCHSPIHGFLPKCEFDGDERNALSGYTNNRSRTDASYIEKWFSTNEEARQNMDEFAESLNSKLSKLYTFSYDSTSKKVYWNDESVPYIILGRETLRLLSHHNFVDLTNKPATLTCFKTEIFPKKQLRLDKPHLRAAMSKVIRHDLSLKKPKLPKEGAYCVRFPIIDIQLSMQAGNNVEIDDSPINKQTIPCINSIEEADQAIEEFEIATMSKFILYTNRKFDIAQSKIRWDETLTPYVIIQSKTLACQHGKDYNKSHNDKRRTPSEQISEHTSPHAKRQRQRSSKKMDCKAKIRIKHLMKFPEHRITTSDSFEQTGKNKLIHRLLISQDPSLHKEHVCEIIFPTNEDHSGHPLGEAAAMNQTIDKAITKKIDQLVDEGVRSIPAIQEALQSYVTNELFKDREPPHTTNRRFYPTKTSIRNHYALAKRRKAKTEELDSKKEVIVDNSEQQDKIVERLIEIQNLMYNVKSKQSLTDILCYLDAAVGIAQNCNEESEIALEPVDDDYTQPNTKRKSHCDNLIEISPKKLCYPSSEMFLS